MLEISDLCVRYDGAAAVEHFDLAVAAGEVVTVLGPTGCGKSSVLKAIAGMEPVASGSIHIDALRIDRARPVPPEKRGVGLVFQDFALFPHLTVAQNVAFRVRDRALAERWIADLGLTAWRDAMPETLSGGQKQRVALARCMAHEPRVVLLDEPLSNLDAAFKATLRWQIRDVLAAAGVPAIWVTHDQDEALSVGDRVAIMNEGRLVQVDAPERCYMAPADRFVATFLGDGVFLRGELDGAGRSRDRRVHTVLGCAPALTAGSCRSAEGGSGAGSTAGADLSERTMPRGDAEERGAAGSAVAGSEVEAGTVDVLLRPHDLRIDRTEDANATVMRGRYEGESRLWAVELVGGEQLYVRTSHEQRFEAGEPVRVRIGARHPLAVFPAA